ncbi:helix-turn-helix domain-containing protein [Pseudomonas silvicola]|nr:helix-turn-helix domain-containing protein [Pseudomonas silvicola]
MMQSKFGISYSLSQDPMSIRHAFAAALKRLRGRQNLLQQQLSSTVSQSHISQLEAGKTSPTLEASQKIAEALAVHPASLVIVTFAARDNLSPREILRLAEEELESLGLLDELVQREEPSDHPVTTKSLRTRQHVQALKAKGLRQTDVVRELGIARSTVARHWS